MCRGPIGFFWATHESMHGSLSNASRPPPEGKLYTFAASESGRALRRVWGGPALAGLWTRLGDGSWPAVGVKAGVPRPSRKAPRPRTLPYGSCISIRSACRSRPGRGSGLVQAPFFLQWRSGLVRASEQVAFAFLAGAVWVGCCLAPPARCLAGFSCAPW